MGFNNFDTSTCKHRFYGAFISRLEKRTAAKIARTQL